MGRKPAKGKYSMPVEKKEPLSPEKAIREIRNLRTADLHLGNMEYVDLLLAEHDRAVARIAELAGDYETAANNVQAEHDQAIRLQAQIDGALALLNEYLVGRTYTDLDDALRNLLQAYVSNKDNAEEADRLLGRWKKAVEGLTPSGSEFVDDPEACAKHIRAYRDSQHETILRLKKSLDEALANRALPESIQEALNSGDGAYRP